MWTQFLGETMSVPASKPLSLSDYEGQTAQVVRLDLPATEALRLKSMGVFVGQSIVVRKLGNPLILTAAGGRIAIAREVARHILVQVGDDQAA